MVAPTRPRGRVPEGLPELVRSNGQPSLVIDEAGVPTSATVYDVMCGKICGIRIVANPEKAPRAHRDLGA